MLLMIEGLWKSYPGPEGPVPVLRGVTLSLDAGETLALTGESGSGKSTLLHLVAGLDAADGGHVLLDGQEVTALDDSGRAQGLISVNGALAVAAPSNAHRTAFVQAVWDQPIPDGDFRYYDGLLYMMSMLVLSGRMQVY